MSSSEFDSDAISLSSQDMNLVPSDYPLTDPPPPPPPPDKFLKHTLPNPEGLQDEGGGVSEVPTSGLRVSDTSIKNKFDHQHPYQNHHRGLKRHHFDPEDKNLLSVEEENAGIFHVENTRYLADPSNGTSSSRYSNHLPQQHDAILNNNTHEEEPSRSSFTQTFLRGILSSLESKDPVVANAWLETLLDAIDLLPVEVIRQEIISIAVAKGELSQPVCSRLASCQILGKLATKLDVLTVRQEILPVTLSLSQDIQWEVRKCMCTQLAYVARGVGLDLTKSAVIPVLVELSNDKCVAVRVCAVETVVQLLNLLDDTLFTNTIVPLVIKCCENARSSEDATLVVLARQFGSLCHGLGKHLSRAQRLWFVQFFQFLATLGASNDGESKGNPMPDLVPRTNPDPVAMNEATAQLYLECRQACALTLPGVLLFTSGGETASMTVSDESSEDSAAANNTADNEECASIVVSILCKLVRDPGACVRSTLASSLSQLVWILGARLTSLQEEMVVLFNDSEVTVLTCMVNAMVFIIDALARYGVLEYGCTSQYGEELGFAILHMEEVVSQTRDWRLHSDCLEKISCLANCISKTMIQENFVPRLMERATKSRPLPTRVAAVRTLLVILRFTIKLEDREKILHRIETDLKLGRSCHTRQLFLKLCEMSLMLFSKAYFKKHFFHLFISLYKDSVPNVRLRLVTLLPQVRSTLQLPEDSHLLTMIESTIKELLLTETDRDVLAALQTSIGTIEEADITSLSSFHCKEDERKEREEQLILNMESEPPPSAGNGSPPASPISFQPAAPSRLRSLVAGERKRSESLPPTLKRRPLVVERLMSAPSPQSSDNSTSESSTLLKNAMSSSRSELKPSWKKENMTTLNTVSGNQNKSFSTNPAANNIDTNEHEFLVDAGVILSNNNTVKSLASSLPNLSVINNPNLVVANSSTKAASLLTASGNSSPRAASPVVLRRKGSKTSTSDEEEEITNCLISNEEMMHYEKEFERASSLSPSPFSSSLTSDNLSSGKLRSGLIKTKLTKNLDENILSRSMMTPSPSSSPRSSPKFSLRSSLTDPSPPPRRWNDGTIERMAEKWAAKRDSLRRETGFVPESLQGARKAAMEQKLESVKRSIPRGAGVGIANTPLNNGQKRLSLNNDLDDKQLQFKSRISPKRKSLDFESAFDNRSSSPQLSPGQPRSLPTTFGRSRYSNKDDNSASFSRHFGDKSADSNKEGAKREENITSPTELSSLPPPPSGFFNTKLPSPDFDSSDSDDSLPPYPNIPSSNSNNDLKIADLDNADTISCISDLQDIDDLLPPPPPDIDECAFEPLHDLTKNLKLIRPASALDISSKGDHMTITNPTKSIDDLSLATVQKNKNLLTKMQLPQKSLPSYYKTVPAPHTSVAVSKTLPSPRRSIAGSLKSPADLKIHHLKISDEKLNTDEDLKDIIKKVDEINNDLFVEQNNNVISSLSSPKQSTERTLKETTNKISIESKLNQKYYTPTTSATTLEIIDQVAEGPSQIIIKSADTEVDDGKKPQTHSRLGIKKTGTYISLQDHDPVSHARTISPTPTSSSLRTPKKSSISTSTSTLPRSKLSTSSGANSSRLLANHQRRSYGGGVVESTKLSTPTSQSSLRFLSAPSTPRTSTSDLRTLRMSPGRSPVGSSSNLRKGSSQELRKVTGALGAELRKGASQELRKQGSSQELRKQGSSSELLRSQDSNSELRKPGPSINNFNKESSSKPKLIVTSEPTQKNAININEITITSFDKHKSLSKLSYSSSPILPMRSASQSNVASSTITSPLTTTSDTLQSSITSAGRSRLAKSKMNRYSLDLRDPKAVPSTLSPSVRTIGGSLDFTSRHQSSLSSSTLSSTTLVVASASNLSSIESQSHLVGKPMLSHSTQSTTSYQLSNSNSKSKIGQMAAVAKTNDASDSKNTNSSASKQYAYNAIRSMSSAAMNVMNSPVITKSSAVKSNLTVASVTNTNNVNSQGSEGHKSKNSQLSSSKLVQANTATSSPNLSKNKSSTKQKNEEEDKSSGQPTQIMKSFAMRFSSKLVPNMSMKTGTSSPKVPHKENLKSSPPTPVHLSPPSKVRGNKLLSGGSSSKLLTPNTDSSKLSTPTRSGGSSKLSMMPQGTAGSSSKSKLTSAIPGTVGTSKVSSADNDRHLKMPSSSSSKLKAPGASNSLQYSQDPANNLQYSNMAAPKPAVQHGASGLAKPTIPSMPRQSKLSRPGLPTPKY